MKSILKILFVAAIIGSSIGCEELEIGNDFLAKPPGADITIDTVYANIENAERALTAAYSTLPYRLPHGWGQGDNLMNMEVLESLTDLCQSYLNWGGVNTHYYSM